MKLGLMVMMLALLALSARAQELKPLPDMSPAKAPTARNAKAVVTKPVEATIPALSAETRQEIIPLVEQLGANDSKRPRLFERVRFTFA